jgi:uncharacterized membrane protein YgaE (UPF0421/DUF939 family)
LVQRTAAATVAWLIARRIGDHPDPFFAPIAAVISLNASLGERGLNALRLLLGVIVGILAGEITLLIMGGGYGSLAVATFAGMTIARALGGAPVVVAQAGAGAILTIAVADGQVGPDRLVDALIGAGVALVFSNLLFTPDPLRLLRRAQSAALEGMAHSLRLTAHSLADDDQVAGDQAMRQLLGLTEHLAALRKASAASARVARHSLAWRSRIASVVDEQKNAARLDLLGVSCLTLARTALAINPAGDRGLSNSVGQIAELMTELARAPAETSVRQSVVERLPVVLGNAEGQLHSFATTTPSSVEVTFVALRMVAVDMMVFAGVDAADATHAVNEGSSARLRVTPLPGPVKTYFPFRFLRPR